jgi:prepilin-type N-terminal cleavage/methylation domain-containing protein
MRQRGFTLIELLVVMAILATLAGVLLAVIPLVFGASDETKCQRNLQDIGTCLFEYQRKFGGTNMSSPSETGVNFMKKLRSKVPLQGGDPDRNHYSCPFFKRNPKEEPADRDAVDYRGPARNINPNSDYKVTDPIVGDKLLPDGKVIHGDGDPDNDGVFVLTKSGTSVFRIRRSETDRWNNYLNRTID